MHKYDFGTRQLLNDQIDVNIEADIIFANNCIHTRFLIKFKRVNWPENETTSLYKMMIYLQIKRYKQFSKHSTMIPQNINNSQNTLIDMVPHNKTGHTVIIINLE